MTFDEGVNSYIREYRDRARAEMRFFEIQRSPSVAIRKAALCQLPSGKRHPHQRRIPGALLEQVEARLQGIGRNLARAADFAALHGAVDDEVGGIKGIGALTVYDIAHRIGAHFKKSPERVYLHAGTRLARVCSMSVVIPLTRRFCPKHLCAWHHRKSRIASAYLRMSFAAGRTRKPHVASPDALLQFGDGVLGSDFGGLIPNSIKYISELGIADLRSGGGTRRKRARIVANHSRFMRESEARDSGNLGRTKLPGSILPGESH
jgi:hypothetical protein